MNIKGYVVIIRAIEDKDNEMLLSIINDSETEYMLGGWSFPVSSSDQEKWTSRLTDDKNSLRCAIDVSDKPIGVVTLTGIDYKNGTAEVGIKLINSNVRGKGYGTDTLNTIVKYAFNELRLNCIYARISQHNVISLGLFKKCGFEAEGILKSRLFKRGKYIDVVSLSIINPNL